MKSCFLWMNQKSGSLRLNLSAKMLLKIIEITAKGLEQYISLVNKIASGFERIDSSFQRSFKTSSVVQWLRFCASPAGGMGSILHAVWFRQNKTKKFFYGKILTNSIACYRETGCERKSQLMQQMQNFIVVLF